jgi:hydroxymethylbilane synthase
LSLAQTEEVLAPLRAAFPGVEISVVPITTGGDRRKEAPLLSMPRGMFAREIEVALLEERIDLAVHSAKDLPAQLPDGLAIAALTQRRDPRDVLVNRWRLPLSELPSGARLGTSSPRRTAQIKALRPDLEVVPIRGNVGTRLEKAKGEGYDGVVLAAAGLERLGLRDEVCEYFSPDRFTPEVGQGALLVETRTSDSRVSGMLSRVDHHPTNAEVTSERAFLAEVGGGCRVPVAAYAVLEDNALEISAMAATPDGGRIFRSRTTHDAARPAAAGREAAQALMDVGASEIVSGDPDS